MNEIETTMNEIETTMNELENTMNSIEILMNDLAPGPMVCEPLMNRIDTNALDFPPNVDELETMVSEMKIKENDKNDKLLEKIRSQTSLLGMCIMARSYLNPQSLKNIEMIIKEHLEIGPAQNETSGDGMKNDNNYEIKVSIHAKKSKLNFVQIRPDHMVDFYIFVAYNMYDKGNNSLGKAHIMKIPSSELYKIVVDYGGYAHGTTDILGAITKDNMKGRGCEYALRCNPNSKENTKSDELWKKLLTYEVDYKKENF
jgi:hypothetical protein|uniref:Uncharacterized protein n=1 Tax=viral metagenome TaxID=1070528 RepID=A0A6C0IQR4_9ZZZZ